MDTTNVIFDSVLLMFLPSQELRKSWIRWSDHQETFSSIKLPFHHIKAELVNRLLPGIWWRICDQHVFRIKLLKLLSNLVLLGFSVETPTMLMVNRFTNLHVQSWHVPTKTSVAAKEFHNITLASLTEPVSLLEKVSLSIFSYVWFIVMSIFNCKWDRIWTVKSRNSNIMPFIMITPDLRLIDTHIVNILHIENTRAAWGHFFRHEWAILQIENYFLFFRHEWNWNISLVFTISSVFCVFEFLQYIIEYSKTQLVVETWVFCNLSFLCAYMQSKCQRKNEFSICKNLQHFYL